MSFSLKNIIFSLFGRYEKEADSYKDIDGKGIQERFNESVAEDFDEELLPLIENLHANTKNPVTLRSEYLPLIESDRGIEQLSGLEIEQRRRFVRFVLAIVSLKGTKRAYELLFRYMGLTLDSIEEDFTGQAFDDETLTFDQDNLFDSGNCGCPLYDLKISGTEPITDDLYSYFLKAIKFIEPVTAKLNTFELNGGELSQFYPFAVWSRNSGAVSLLVDGDITKVVNIDWDAPTESFEPDLSNEYQTGSPASIDFLGVDKLRRHDIYFIDETAITGFIADNQELRKNLNMGIFSAVDTVDVSDNFLTGFMFGRFAGNNGLVVDLSFNQVRASGILGIAVSALSNIQANGSSGNQITWANNNSWQDGLSVDEMNLIESNALQLYALGFNFVYSNFGFKNVV